MQAVPADPEAAADTSAALADLVAMLHGRRVVALTGAGCSTESGIPDYRGPTTRMRARNPVQYREFVESAAVRRRYWARSMLGWPRFASARPNPAHLALGTLERAGTLVGVITQNVDRLHHAAGSRRVVELHGTLTEVHCRECGAREQRSALQRRLERLNPGWAEQRVELAPDGDAELDAGAHDGFCPADCGACGGTLKPSVVFFGESVPRATTDAAWRLYEQGEVLLVVGSSLAVASGFRFARRAAREGKPLAIVNLGPTRGDALARVRVQRPAGAILPVVVERLCG